MQVRQAATIERQWTAVAVFCDTDNTKELYCHHNILSKFVNDATQHEHSFTAVTCEIDGVERAMMRLSDLNNISGADHAVAHEIYRTIAGLSGGL